MHNCHFFILCFFTSNQNPNQWGNQQKPNSSWNGQQMGQGNNVNENQWQANNPNNNGGNTWNQGRRGSSENWNQNEQSQTETGTWGGDAASNKPGSISSWGDGPEAEWSGNKKPQVSFTFLAMI